MTQTNASRLMNILFRHTRHTSVDDVSARHSWTTVGRCQVGIRVKWSTASRTTGSRGNEASDDEHQLLVSRSTRTNALARRIPLMATVNRFSANSLTPIRLVRETHSWSSFANCESGFSLINTKGSTLCKGIIRIDTIMVGWRFVVTNGTRIELGFRLELR